MALVFLCLVYVTGSVFLYHIYGEGIKVTQMEYRIHIYIYIYMEVVSVLKMKWKVAFERNEEDPGILFLGSIT